MSNVISLNSAPVQTVSATVVVKQLQTGGYQLVVNGTVIGDPGGVVSRQIRAAVNKQ